MKSVRVIREQFGKAKIPTEWKQSVEVELDTLAAHERKNGGTLPLNNQTYASYHNLRKIFKLCTHE